MITRIVKLTIQPEKAGDFITLFNESKALISEFSGCIQVEALRDIHHNNLFFTYSTWQSEEHLNKYRQSELFKNIWSRTKPLFSEKAEAWSFEKLKA